MIKKLRIRLVAAAMASLFAVLFVVVAMINIANYHGLTRAADNTIESLMQNGGRFENRPARPEGPSAELPYISRYFVAYLDIDGEVIFVNTDKIASVDIETAREMTEDVLRKHKEKGFFGDFRFQVKDLQNGQMAIFLDCRRELATYEDFLLSSIVMALCGMLAVFVLLLFFSARIVGPINEAYEKQKQFITNAGHELKTPITVINADTEVLEMENGENEWTDDIKRQTKRLSDLTQNLIYLSKMQEENAKIVFLDFPVSDIVSETAQSFLSLAKTQNKDIHVEIEPMLSLCGDEKAVRQLVCILLDNALKYSNAGGYICVYLKKRGKNILLSVANSTAFEVKNENINSIFERFYRLDPSHSSEISGQGIGLSIAKAIMDTHKGKIFAYTVDGRSICITAVF